jgi:hypothetical protein
VVAILIRITLASCVVTTAHDALFAVAWMTLGERGLGDVIMNNAVRCMLQCATIACEPGRARESLGRALEANRREPLAGT